MLIESNHWRVFLVTSRLVSIYNFRQEIMVNVKGSFVFAFVFVVWFTSSSILATKDLVTLLECA